LNAVRVLGNDYTHYERKYDEVEFTVLKQYLNIFIATIDAKYLIKHKNQIVKKNPKL